MDYTGATPITTTYANDVFGLTQVLVADDGTTEVYNLLGLDLISQDSGSEVRTLLVDGLGSVRLEMVGGVVETATTYTPYGEVLEQVGTSSTVYGFTGEHEDEATGLLYLRARYYSSELKTFMSRDSWSGIQERPQSMNGMSYADNDPINLTDPTGRIPFRAAYCKSSSTFYEYRDCVLNEYGLDHDLDIEYVQFEYQGGPGCWYGPVPYRTRGYTEGTSFTFAAAIGYTSGYETVYDFATMERQTFQYRGGGIFGEIGGGVTQYAGLIAGFRSWKPPEPGTSRIATDYTGLFRFSIVGGGLPTPIIGVTLGKINFEGVPDASVHGSAWYASISAGASTGFDRGEGWTFYTSLPARYEDYRSLPDSRGRRRVDRTIVSDVSSGAHTPWIWPVGNRGIDRWVRDNLYGVRSLIQQQIYLYEQINYYSYGPGESAEDPTDPPQ